MTPAERARQIDQQEYEAECRAARKRAMQHAEACRQDEAARVAAWLGREAPTSSNRTILGRKPKLYTYNGQSKTLSEWAEIAGVSYQTFAQRIHSGMEFERAITMKKSERAQLHTINGEAKTLQQWADHAGVTYNTLSQRIHRGSTLAEAVAMPAGRWRGVSLNLPPLMGTGAGSTAQEIPEITFSEKAKSQ